MRTRPKPPRRALIALCVTEITSWGVPYYAFPVMLVSLTRDTGWSTATALTGWAVVTIPLHALCLPAPWPARAGGGEGARRRDDHARSVVRSRTFVTLTAGMTFAAFGCYAATASLSRPAVARSSPGSPADFPAAYALLAGITLAAALAATIAGSDRCRVTPRRPSRGTAPHAVCPP